MNAVDNSPRTGNQCFKKLGEHRIPMFFYLKMCSQIIPTCLINHYQLKKLVSHGVGCRTIVSALWTLDTARSTQRTVEGVMFVAGYLKRVRGC